MHPFQNVAPQVGGLEASGSEQRAARGFGLVRSWGLAAAMHVTLLYNRGH